MPAPELNSCLVAKATDVRRTTYAVNINKKRGAAMRAAPHTYRLDTLIRSGGLHVYRGKESEAVTRGDIFGYGETLT